MSEGDIEDVARLERANFSQPWSESGIGHYLDSGSTIFVVAKHESRLVGYAAVLRIIDEGNLISIVVEEEYRNMGIAREILDIVYDIARGYKLTKIHLEVRRTNEAAISLYEKEGFALVGERKGFYDKPKEDALLYTKEL